MRARAQQLLTLELGPRSDLEIRHSLETQVGSERWTKLDRVLSRDAAAHGGVIDLRPEPGQQREELRAIKIGRIRKLERSVSPIDSVQANGRFPRTQRMCFESSASAMTSSSASIEA